MDFFDSIADAFSRDGSATKVFEKLPVIGHITAGVQYIAGNPEHAKRALATSTGSLVTTAGAVGGFLIAGPPGAIAGGALASSAGIGTEYLISTTIEDDGVKGDVGDTSLGRFASDALLSGATGFMGGGGGGVIGKQLGQTLGKEGLKSVGKEMGKTVGSAALTGALTGAGQALKGPKPGLGSIPKVEDPEGKQIRIITRQQAAKTQEVAKLCLDLVKGDFDRNPLSDSLRNCATAMGAIVQGMDYSQGEPIFNEGKRYYVDRRPHMEDRMIEALKAAGKVTSNNEAGTKTVLSNGLLNIEECLGDCAILMEHDVEYRYEL